jgi:hypothetical protein
MTAAEREASEHASSDGPAWCDFCKTTELTLWKCEVNTEDATRSYRFRVCPSCGWWTTTDIEQLNYIPGYDADFHFYSYCSSLRDHFAVLDSFKIGEDTAPLDEVRAVLANDWRYSKYISAKKAQDLVLSVFRSHMNCEIYYYDDAVFSPDGGIDFVLVRADESKIAFQVKKRMTDKLESIRCVREFIGAVANSPFREGFFVTTAPLSNYAVKELDSSEANLRDKNITLTVVDGTRLRGIMELHKPSPKSLTALSTIVPASGWTSAVLAGELDIASVLEESRNIGYRTAGRQN